MGLHHKHSTLHQEPGMSPVQLVSLRDWQINPRENWTGDILELNFTSAASERENLIYGSYVQIFDGFVAETEYEKRWRVF